MNASTRNIVQRRWLDDVDLDRRDRCDRPTLPTDVIAAMEDAAGAGGDRRDNGQRLVAPMCVLVRAPGLVVRCAGDSKQPPDFP
uniref:Uncharacterized protein n=1 Tax=Plectus sambesii TaxID=2011161 RepID=A0A914V4D3_9BILA